MDDEREKKSTGLPDEAELLRGREFDAADALAREAAGTLKGASPVPAAKQVLFICEEILERSLPDPEGSLIRTIVASLENEPALLADHREDPAAALASFLDRILGSAPLLDALVRQTDARWGREYDERPHFENDEGPAHPDDPYTREGVRDALVRLRNELDGEA